jgi:hypothetical protein
MCFVRERRRGMRSGFLVSVVAAFAIISAALYGCRAKVEKPAAEEAVVETAVSEPAAGPGAMLAAQDIAKHTVIEPAQSVGAETIPPTAAVQQAAGKAQAAVPPADDRSRDIQTALKNAGFYNGAVDGKIGPKTKSAIEEFQKAKGLKADGRVGPKTWAELEKYLLKQ